MGGCRTHFASHGGPSSSSLDAIERVFVTVALCLLHRRRRPSSRVGQCVCALLCSFFNSLSLSLSLYLSICICLIFLSLALSLSVSAYIVISFTYSHTPCLPICQLHRQMLLFKHIIYSNSFRFNIFCVRLLPLLPLVFSSSFFFQITQNKKKKKGIAASSTWSTWRAAKTSAGHRSAGRNCERHNTSIAPWLRWRTCFSPSTRTARTCRRAIRN
jgi:hypothetical protein